jgi:hypothetical protein
MKARQRKISISCCLSYVEVSKKEMFPQNRKGKALPNLFYEANITVIPKPEKRTTGQFP